jgi:mono/diheme cytochrome c family protein
MMPRWSLLIGLAGLAAVVAAVAIAGVERELETTSVVARGRALYGEHCASCHGAELEGQPNWQTVGPNGKVLAPPHDATGHTWQHTDDELFRLTKFSVKDVAPDGYVSDMPAFADKLTDEQIWAVLGYIKSRWPRDIRAYQAMITNPTAAQAATLGDDWRFPPLCKEEPSRNVAAARQQATRQSAPAPAAR